MRPLLPALVVLDRLVPGVSAMSRTTTASRTLAYCRSLGWFAGVVERRLPKTFTTVDLFGFIDVVVLDGKPGILAVQCTSGAHGADRIAKIYDECWPEAEAWLQSGGRIEVWAWAKRGARGKRKLWSPRITPIIEKLTLEEAINNLPF